MELDWQREDRQYRESGSFRFSDAQRSAYALYFDITILSYVSFAYESLKTIPNEGFWGNATIFQGAVPVKKETLRFAKMRVISRIERETYIVAQANDQYDFLQLTLAAGFGELVPFFIPGESRGAQILAIPDTVVKFRSLPASQFQFTCHWLPFPEFLAEELDFVPEDPTDGDDEYSTPRRNTPDDPYAFNAPPSLPDPDSDDRDYGDDNNIIFPRPVYFGLEFLLSSGVGQPNGCVGDSPVSSNIVWETAGPPPYTIEFGYLGSPCAGLGSGSRIRAADGSVSQDFTEFATTISAEIVVFQFTPF